jgi:GT2 family glycosyltransferase
VNVAVLTLTRDRLEYTQHCFAALREFAGCDFDHYVLDQDSEDGTLAWLVDEHDAGRLRLSTLGENVGICKGMNDLVLRTFDVDDYDVIVKFDNDCELRDDNTLRDVSELAIEGGAILSPQIRGLRNTPKPIRELRIGDDTILDVPQIGGIFMAVPAWTYTEFRYDESQMLYDDVQICQWWRQQGGTCGYVQRLEAWHYETTDGQHERYPEYFDRKYAEMGEPAWR